jgi:hypothetical protein
VIVSEEHFEQHYISSELTGDETPVIKADSGVYLPMRRLCGGLNLQTQTQTNRLREDPLYDGMIRQFPMRTRGGVQLVWCLNVDAVGMWLGSISSARVPTDRRARLLEYQRELMSLARALLFGEIESEAIIPALASLDRRRLERVEADQAGQTRALRVTLQRLNRIEARIGRLEESRDDNE